MMVTLLALVTLLATVALAVGLYSLYCANRLFYKTQRTMDALRAEHSSAMEAAQSHVNAVVAELESWKSPPLPEISLGTPKPCMNLTRRSNALRLRRKGASPEQIAAALDVPRQEVELLLKVHEIVLNNL